VAGKDQLFKAGAVGHGVRLVSGMERGVTSGY
jgi:hypothetical protein